MNLYEIATTFAWVFSALCMATLLGQEEGTWIEVEYTIVEEMPPNAVVGNLSESLHFKDGGVSSQEGLQFSFLPQSSQYQQLFTIEPRYGLLRTNSVIDRDEACARSMECDMLLDVAVIGPDRDFQIIKVTVHIEDINDNAPAFSSDTLTLSISETALPGVSFVLPQAWDPDSGKFGVQSYRLTTPTNKFSLNISLGTEGTIDMRLTLLSRLDREEQAGYTLEVVATDGGTPSLTGTLTLEVKVMDANDNSPVFELPVYEIRVREDTMVGDTILQVVATDPDAGHNAEIIYSLASPTPNVNTGLLIFGIRNSTGEIFLRKGLDFEVQTAYHLLVTATDKGADAIPTQARVVILVDDVNDHPPTISVNALTDTGNAEIPENAEPGLFVAHVSIEDLDSGPSGVVTCQLSSGPFELRQLYRNVFKVVATAMFDSETRNSYTLTLSCRDEGDPPLSASRDIHVSVIDENDHTPVFTQDVYSATLKENTSVGLRVVQVNATDGDSGENARLTYSLRGNASAAFHINPMTGAITAASRLDFEVMHNARFFVVAADHGDPPRSSSASVVVNIVDVNDEPPLFYHDGYSFALAENSPPGTEVGTVGASDRDSSPYNQILYSIVTGETEADDFSIDAGSGIIKTRRALDREYKPSYILLVKAENPGYPSMTSVVKITVLLRDINDNAPTILFPNNTSNIVNIPYRAPEGFIFTKVVAMDVDIGENARLSYAIAKTSNEGIFDIDQATGAMSIKSHELWSLGEEFEVLITVADHGIPPKMSSIEMLIVVNKSVIYPGLRDLYEGSGNKQAVPGQVRLNHNQTVLISLGIVTVLLVTILIVAIILVRRRRYKEDDDEPATGQGPHDQNNFLKIQPSARAANGQEYAENETLPESDSQESGVYSEESTDRGLKEVKFINNISGGILVKNGPQVSLVSNKIAQNEPSKACYPAIPNSTHSSISNVHEDSWPSGQGTKGVLEENTPRPLVESSEDTQYRPWPLTQKELEVHQLLSRMSLQQPEGSDTDSTSGCSAEVSTTDSGRGPSEDGDHLTPPCVSRENKQDDMNHPTSQTGDGLHVPSRTPGRSSRAGTRPPTGTKPPPHGRHPANVDQTPYATKCGGRYPHSHPTPSTLTVPSGHTRTSMPYQIPTADAPAQARGKQRRWNSPAECPSGARLTVLEKPTHAGAQDRGEPSTYHGRRDPLVTYQGQRNGHPVTDPSSCGKLLIWERFRNQTACGDSLVGGQSPGCSESVHDATTTQDEMSDDASTTSGSYVLDMDDVRQRAIVVGERDSFV